MSGKNPKISKGTSSAVLLSIAIHAALFLLAGMLVVFSVVNKKEEKFIQVKTVERPRMKLRKLRVRPKKSRAPKVPDRIVTTAQKSSLPPINMPSLGGIGEGLGDMLDGFAMMPDLGEITLFGNNLSIGNDFVGSFYDLKRDPRGRPIPYSTQAYRDATRRFLQSGWKSSSLARYYKSPKKRYTTTFMVPPMISALVPAMFNEPETEGIFWITHYTGSLVHKDGITFRFFGQGDGTIAVRVDGKVVLISGWLEPENLVWRPSSADHLKYWLGNDKASAGDWITLEPGVPIPMEVLMVEGGGQGCFMLVVEEKGVEYDNRTIGGPTFPAFKTAEISRDMLDVIYRNLVPGEVSLTNGPIFRDYDVVEETATKTAKNNELPETVLPESGSMDPVLRTWKGVDGKTMEAEFIAVIGNMAVIKSPMGKQIRLPLAQLSTADLEYIELVNPPSFDIDFSAKTEPVFSVVEGGSSGLIVAYDYCAGVRVEQTSAGTYTQDFFVEFFAIGKEIHGNRYVLLDRQKNGFTLNGKNQRSYEFNGRTVRIPDFTLYGQDRGEKPFGYLVMLTDSHGNTIAHKESHAWLHENLGNLKSLPVGAYMNKACIRVFPTGPRRSFY
jgi:hypothetical protein